MTFLTRLREFAGSLALKPKAQNTKPALVKPPVAKPAPLPANIKAANEAINAQPLSKAQELPPVTHPAFDAPFTNRRALALTAADKIRAAEHLGVTVGHINMLLKVESSGRSFDNKGRPIILFEPHIFHRRTGGKWSPSSFSYAKWRTKPYPKTADARWAQMEAAAEKDRSAALESASWGLFQVMGFHWQALGYADAFDFAAAMTTGEPAQLDAMVRFIVANRLKSALQACRAGDPDSCRAFARGYNGAGFEKNRYHIKLAEALK